MSFYGSFSIGLSALNAYRQGLDTTGYNIANATTPGFARRRVHLSAAYVNGGLYGGEVSVGVRAQVSRARDPFLDFAVRREMSRLGGDQAQLEVLATLEASFGTVDSAPVQTEMSRLFDSLQTLAVDPSGITGRNEVLSAAEGVARAVRTLDGELETAQRSADARLRGAIEDINQSLESIDELNRKIVAAEASGQEAGGLRDERELLLDGLSGALDVDVITDDEGRALVSISGIGDPLVSASGAKQLSFVEDAQGFARVQTQRAGSGFDVTDELSGKGGIGGLIASRDVTISGYRDTLDQLASTLAGEFNARLATGYDLDGQPGIALFEPVSGSGAASDFRVSAAIEGQPRRLAFSGSAAEAGDGSVLQELIALREDGLASLGGQSFVGFTSDFLAEAGRDVASTQAQYEASELIVGALDARRAEVSSVSLDEEAANLLIWQRSFEAAARFLETVNSVTEIAVNLGR